MSIQSAKEFIEKVSTDKEFLKSCNDLENTEQKNIFLKENGFNFTNEELKEVTSELSNDDLDGAVGGATGDAFHRFYTIENGEEILLPRGKIIGGYFSL